ncbi:MAG TPA: sugar phosphate isomerase/epimerase [Candidatus Dormibacteraeota bacterium]|nr:sugar phosphate isomerase/epimerase [Candidatus Dormibacteraeota bacterium]
MKKDGSRMFRDKDVTRRELVKAGAVAAAGMALSGAALGAAKGEPAGGAGIRLGIASYTFRNFSRAEMIGFLKQAHVSNMNLKDTKDHLPADAVDEIKALGDYLSAGITLHAAGTIYFPKDEDADIRAKFEYAKRAGIGVIVAGDPAVATLPRIEKFVKEYDIKFALHNHGPEDKLWPSPLDVLKAMKSMDPRMGCCIDVGHTVRAGTDVVAAIREVGPRVFNVHIKDLTSFTEKESQVEVGQGKMPVKNIFEALMGIGYAGFVDLEYEINEKNPLPGVIESLAYMRGVLAGMA